MLLRGWLTDAWSAGSTVQLWITGQDGSVHFVHDTFCPRIYISAPPAYLRRIVLRLMDLQVLADKPRMVQRLHFYQNRLTDAMELVIARPELLRTIRSRLYAFYGKADIYHADIDPVTQYFTERDTFPFAEVEVETDARNRLTGLRTLSSQSELEYSMPPLRVATIRFANSHRLPLSPRNPLLLESGNQIREIPDRWAAAQLAAEFFAGSDPDIIYTEHGDQSVLPELFTASNGRPFGFDRNAPWQRKVHRQGSSYTSYGSVIYRAPSYPAFGRLHIDMANSFLYKDSRFEGIVELARLARVPVQRMARVSTGGALTAMESENAIKRGYLVPWQKSKVEHSKTARELLRNDKGGLVFHPEVPHGGCRVFSRVVQIDYSQMYPTIMVHHNISPETVICDCCAADAREFVPELGYRICHRRRGVVSETLEHILERRRFYKTHRRQNPSFETRQSALKWMLVTSFGYLGYRNAKFGRIESHESVTAFGRDKLLTAKEIAEDAGWHLLHAITDCLFLQAPPGDSPVAGMAEPLLKEITRRTAVEMNLDVAYDWLVFLPSKTDPALSVAGGYFGRVSDGSIKMRGILARRKDMPSFIRHWQIDFLQWMAGFPRANDLRQARCEAIAWLGRGTSELAQADWRELLLRRTVTRPMEDYTVNNATSSSLRSLAGQGIRITPGEKVRYLLADASAPADRRYIPEEKAAGMSRVPVDRTWYRKLLQKAWLELWEPFDASAPEALQSQLSLWH